MIALPETINPAALREFARIDKAINRSDDPGPWRVRLAQFETEQGRAAMVELRAALATRKAGNPSRQPELAGATR